MHRRRFSRGLSVSVVTVALVTVRTVPIDPMSLTESVRLRFENKVAEPDTHGCRLWLAGASSKGYGAFGLRGRGMVSAHRVAYVLATGSDIPEGMVIDHLCRVRLCVNPEHLRVVTNRENLHADGSLHWAPARAQKTHCPRGHRLAGDNLSPVQLRRGRRQCRACMQAHNRLSGHRRRHGTPWDEGQLRALADQIYRQFSTAQEGATDT